jgi:Tfp pilus assembly protein PilF
MVSSFTKIAAFCTTKSRKFDLYRMTLLVFTGLIVYSNTLYSPFIFDDAANIINNPLIADLSLAGLKESFQSRRAIGIITFQLNYFFSEWSVPGYHVTNIFIHIVASLAVYRVLQLLMNTEYMKDNADDWFRNLPLPFFAALLFVAHPVQTQAVTYIVQRFASLATLFYLVAIISFLTARINQIDSGRILTISSVAWFFVTLLAGFLALNTKETAYTLPLAIMLVELLFFRPTRKKIFWIIAASASTVIAVLLKFASVSHSVQNALSVIDEATRLQTLTTRTDYLLTQFRVIMTYVRLIFLPINQRLDYDLTLSRNFMDWQVFCSFLAIVTLLLAALWMLKYSSAGAPHLRLIAFGILWFFLTLSVESSIIPIIDLIFEHRLYLPLFGAVTAVLSAVMMFAWKGEASGRAVCIGLLLIAFLLGVSSYSRNSDWRSEVSIWVDTVNKSPDSARAWNNLGATYIKQKDPTSSLKAIIKSIELDPSKADAWNNLGIAIDIMGAYNDRFNRTSEMFSTPGAVEGKIVSRWLGDVNNNLGLAYEILGNLPKAAENYRNAVGYNPSLRLAYYNLGIVSAKLNDGSKYSEQLQILMMIDPILAARLQARVEKR